ncbi:hypothetical protein J1605_014133 [Eschrichtius robustus]|uniref:Uncharacterized protein n=1 Tax=Eschrichtius robustus TaxID=9764 RepID=A0AB34GGC0_ESCRO|nr:hypothetical protein J1605_014133 [Eschrichtius robustus]
MVAESLAAAGQAAGEQDAAVEHRGNKKLQARGGCAPSVRYILPGAAENDHIPARALGVRASVVVVHGLSSCGAQA